MSMLSPGEEQPQVNETIHAQLIADQFKATLSDYYRNGDFKRMFHPKMHGLVRAYFKVSEDLPDHLRKGILAESRTFDAWIRFSNAKRKPSPDKNRDMRGMAIKLVGVPGRKLLKMKEQALTQDFLLVTAETLQTRSVRDFQQSIAALLQGGIRLFLYAITHPLVIYRSLKQISKCANVLEKQYFSMTPSLLGDGQAVKYSAVPMKPPTSEMPDKPTDDYLRARLKEDIGKAEQEFKFMIQLQTDPDKMPVEDPTVRWNSPLIEVARIIIPQQEFDSENQRAYGENLSFTPWHSLPEHRPIGGVNRARKLVYEQIAAFRRFKNDVVSQKEPEEIKTF